MRALLHAVLCFLAAGLALAGPARAAATDFTIATADGTRHALLVAAGPGPHPTLIVLHGAAATAQMSLHNTGFAEAALAHGFTAVFADGLHRQWNDARFATDHPDDAGFIAALAARLVAEGIARPGRIYLAGISNGGMMALTLACTTHGLFAGVATVIASLPEAETGCAPDAMPVVMVNATGDPIVPFNGGKVGSGSARGSVLSVDTTARVFARPNGCAARRETVLSVRQGKNHPPVTRIDWTGCKASDPLVQFRIEGGGHRVPGAYPLPGPGSARFSAAAAILAVFAEGR